MLLSHIKSSLLPIFNVDTYSNLKLPIKISILIESFRIWPQYIRDRVHDTYLHMGASVAITAASAVAILKTPAIHNLLHRNKWLSLFGTCALVIGSGIVTLSIPYESEFGAKHLAWILHCASIVR